MKYIQNQSFQQINNSSGVRHFHNKDKQGMYPLLLKSPVSTDPPDPLMIHPLSIHLATLEAALLKPPVNPTLLHIAICRLSTRKRGVRSLPPSWLLSRISAHVLDIGDTSYGINNKPRSRLRFGPQCAEISNPHYWSSALTARRQNFWRSRSRSTLVYWCCRHLATRFNSRIRNVLSALIWMQRLHVITAL